MISQVLIQESITG